MVPGIIILLASISWAGVYRHQGTAGVSLSCTSSQEVRGETTSGGIVTGGTCTTAALGDVVLTATQTFSGYNTFTSTITINPGSLDLGQSGVNNGLIGSGASLIASIDTNNDDTDREFDIRKDAQGASGGTTLMSLKENGVTLFSISSFTVTSAGADVILSSSTTSGIAGIRIIGSSNRVQLNVDRQNDTTNARTQAMIQTGWGALVGDGASSAVSETVTFATAFSTSPTVVVSYSGDAGSAPASTADCTSRQAELQVMARAATTTTFELIFYIRTSVNTSPHCYSWVAIGN